MIRNNIDDNFLYFLKKGDCLDAYKTLGSHLVKDEWGNNIACEFALYAPNALYVELIGDFNGFQEGVTRMEKINDDGIFYSWLDGNYEGNRYKYVIITKGGQKLYKADPYAFRSALRPIQDSIVYNIDYPYDWNDKEWNETHTTTYDKPTLIYEMHLGSWKRKGEGDNDFYNYVEIANMLCDYLKDFGYTHVEIMPVYEHPLDASWGYQGTGYYAITPRYGTPHDFMKFIDILHQNGYGVILDWVPGHICKDSFGLYMFDGTPLYEYPNEQDRENPEWGTANLDLGKGITRSFLYSNALFFMKYFHVDGFRVDAVSNLIYYLGNCHRGTNIGACDFIKTLSNLLFKEDDRVLLIAEDSSAFPNVTKPTSDDGLGFNYKWDMGWMNDTLKYFKLDPDYRKYHHNQLTFSMMYFYNEQFMLPLSHDEVVHMKGSLLNKMPGDQWKQFASYRALMGYMMTHPGKKLLFMGNELASYDEWHYESELPWFILKYPTHDASWRFMKELTKLYKAEPALWERDYQFDGFKWIDANNGDQSMFIFARFAKDPKDHIVVVMNFTPNSYDEYRIGCIANYNYEYVEIMNTDRDYYGGSNMINQEPIKVEKKPFHNQKYSMNIKVGPLSVLMFKARPKKKAK